MAVLPSARGRRSLALLCPAASVPPFPLPARGVSASAARPVPGAALLPVLPGPAPPPWALTWRGATCGTRRLSPTRCTCRPSPPTWACRAAGRAVSAGTGRGTRGGRGRGHGAGDAAAVASGRRDRGDLPARPSCVCFPVPPPVSPPCPSVPRGCHWRCCGRQPCPYPCPHLVTPCPHPCECPHTSPPLSQSCPHPCARPHVSPPHVSPPLSHP